MEQPPPSRRSIAIASTVVFVIAVTIRVPSCYESFWLDELHSAWCVWDALADVFPRADIGHQSPFYFVGLWFWKQIVGETEVALRLSSVLAVAASCGVLTTGVARWTNSVAAGAASGMVMALESNSLFFGTELRPYALVILFASVAIVCFFQLVMLESRREHRGCWSTFILAILLAALAQPSSIGVLIWLPALLFMVWFKRDCRQLCKVTLVDALAGLTIAAIGFTIWNTTLGETWQQRTVWASFATATRLGQIWEAWDWTWMLVVPFGLVLFASIVAALRHQKMPVSNVVWTTAMLALVAVIATSVYWGVSRAQWIPVWHRRYFVAVLPMLACVVGGAVGAAQVALGSSRRGLVVGSLLAIALVIWPPHIRETMTKLRGYPVALVIRGEDWRGAVDWTRARAGLNDLILLDAGLIEANAWLPPGTAQSFPAQSMPAQSMPAQSMPAQSMPAQGKPIRHLMAERRRYLAFPVSGPYRLHRDIVPVRPDRQLVFSTTHAKRRIYGNSTLTWWGGRREIQ